jgi:general secretion pathway protein B
MSLVLEALRRQQADTDPAAAVTLALAADQRKRQRTWVVLLTLALLLNAAVLAWLFRDRLFGIAIQEAAIVEPLPGPASAPTADDTAPTAPGAAGAAAAPTAPGDSPITSAASPSPPTPLPAAAAGPGASAPAAIAPPTPATVYPEVPAARIFERIAFGSLPPEARSRFPGIVISTHVYAEDPALRAIVANGTRLQEGDRVAGLLIREIREDGVVLEFEPYLVEVPVFSDW